MILDKITAHSALVAHQLGENQWGVVKVDTRPFDYSGIVEISTFGRDRIETVVGFPNGKTRLRFRRLGRNKYEMIQLKRRLVFENGAETISIYRPAIERRIDRGVGAYFLLASIRTKVDGQLASKELFSRSVRGVGPLAPPFLSYHSYYYPNFALPHSVFYGPSGRVRCCEWIVQSYPKIIIVWRGNADLYSVKFGFMPKSDRGMLVLQNVYLPLTKLDGQLGIGDIEFTPMTLGGMVPGKAVKYYKLPDTVTQEEIRAGISRFLRDYVAARYRAETVPVPDIVQYVHDLLSPLVDSRLRGILNRQVRALLERL